MATKKTPVKKPAKKTTAKKPAVGKTRNLPPVIKFTRHQQTLLRKQRAKIQDAKMGYADAEIVVRRAKVQANTKLAELQAEEKELGEMINEFAEKHGIDPEGGVNWEVDLDRMTLTRK